MQYFLFEDQTHFDLYPLTFTRPIFDLRVGILKIQEKWSHVLDAPVGSMAYDYLAPLFNNFDPSLESIAFNGKFLPTIDYALAIGHGLSEDSFLLSETGEVLAFRCRPDKLPASFDGLVRESTLVDAGLKARNYDGSLPPAIRHPWDLFQQNGAAIREDFIRVTAGRRSQAVKDTGTRVYGADNLFLEEGVKIRAAILNAEDGPIYLGRQAAVQEGAIVHGSHAILEHATLNMGAKMRGDTTVGPWSKVGGEVANSVIQAYSNKGHDGYMGNSVLGHWCNLGADSNTSNLKNNYSEVKVWNYPLGRFIKTGSIFCGLIMGDHSKCGINTMFNTGTVIGVCANIFGAGYPRNFIPSFSWGGPAGLSTYRLKKVFEVAEAVMGRRKIKLTEADKAILEKIFELSSPSRRWDKD